MAIDNNPLTNMLTAETLRAWGDFFELFNSDYALIFFGVGGVFMGAVAQYNSRLSSSLNKAIVEIYKLFKLISFLVLFSGFSVIFYYVFSDEIRSREIIYFLKDVSFLVYIFVVCIAIILVLSFVIFLNKPYPYLKNNVAGLAWMLSFIYFLFEVVGVEVIPWQYIVLILVFVISIVYIWGDFNSDREAYLKRELAKVEDKRDFILKNLESLSRSKNKPASRRAENFKRSSSVKKRIKRR